MKNGFGLQRDLSGQSPAPRRQREVGRLTGRVLGPYMRTTQWQRRDAVRGDIVEGSGVETRSIRRMLLLARRSDRRRLISCCPRRTAPLINLRVIARRPGHSAGWHGIVRLPRGLECPRPRTTGNAEAARRSVAGHSGGGSCENDENSTWSCSTSMNLGQRPSESRPVGSADVAR